MIPALLGAIGSIASGVLGAGAANRAAEQNYQINLLNYYQRENERWQAIQESRRRDADAKLGSTDAQGNKSRFVEGVGWVSELSNKQKELNDLYKREETQQLTNDLQKQRGVLDDNIKRQGRENNQASALMDAIGRVQRQSPELLESLLNASALKGINAGYDSVAEDAMRSAVRSGASNSGAVAAAIAKQKGSALQDAFMNNRINALQQSDQEYDAKVGNIANLYNMMASRASASPNAGYNPRNIDGAMAGSLSQAMSGGANAGNALLNALAKQGGTMQNVEPNYGLANAVQQGSSALAGAFENMAANRNRDKAYDQLAKYGGQQYQSGKGLW